MGTMQRPARLSQLVGCWCSSIKPSWQPEVMRLVAETSVGPAAGKLMLIIVDSAVHSLRWSQQKLCPQADRLMAAWMARRKQASETISSQGS